MHRTTRLNVTDINQHFVCVICDGYIIDATTIVECLHSFCRTCIVRFLESSKFCPVCDVQVHKTKPLQSIRSDTTLQDVIYKLIPGLYQNEMHRRREFYADHPEAAAKCSTEERGEGAEQRCFYSPKENISLSLEYFKGSESQVESESTSETPDKDVMTRHLNCPAAMTVAHLKKFVRMKFSLPLTYMIKIMYAEHLLSDDYTLMDIAYIYSWRRAGPMKFFYTFAHRKHVAQRQTFPTIEEPTTSKHPKQEESPESDVNKTAPVDNKIAQLPTPSDEPEKMDTEETVQPCATAACEPMQTLETPVSLSSTSTTDTDKMEVTETKIYTPTTQIATPSPSAALPPSVELSSTIVPVSSGIKLKLIQCPAEPKAAKSKKSAGGRKGGRTRYKSAPVPQRFPRLAPYPPPHQSAACLAMRKYNVPNIMTSIAPNLMLSFVPTTANSLCNMNSSNSNKPAILPTTVNSLCNMNTNNNGKPAMLPTTVNSLCSMNTNNNGKPAMLPTPTNSMCNLNSSNSSKPSMLPTTVNSLCNMNNTNSSNPVILPAAVLPTMVNGQDKAPDTTASVCVGQDKKPPTSKIPDDQVQTNAIVTTEALAPRPAFYPPPQQQTVATTCVAPSPLGHLAIANSQAPFGVTSSLMAALISTTVGSTVSNSSPVYKMADMVNGSSKKIVVSKGPEPSMPSILQTALCEDKTGKKSPQVASVAPPEAKVECNGGLTAPSPVASDNKEFQFSPDKKSAFAMSVKNSISAEFSDNDDLGCQPDLVVDEQKMEDDNSEDEEEDNALRKKIAAIAEDNGQDEDSGRASDISSQARCSSCDDDSVPTTTASTTTTCLPSFSLATSSSSSSAVATPNRTSKSNNINHVINNLLLRNHERKDSMGALDLSTCTKTLGGPSRPKPVANPVLDIKHRQQAYLPAPNNSNNSNNNNNNSSKQHTACVPSPKHPILMHGLTSQGLTPLQLSAMHGKSPHLPVPPFHGTAMVYTSQNRTISSPTCVPSGRSPTPTYNTSPSVPSAHQAILSGNFPRMTALPAMSSYPIRSATPTTSAMRNYGPMKGISISPSHNVKATSPNTKGNHMMSPTHNSNHAKSMNSNNHLKGMSSSSSSPNSNHQSSRTFSPAANHIKGLASPPHNPYSKGSSKSHNPPVPSYKKSNFPVYSGGAKKPPANPSYKSYNTKFKSSGNLTVINPDPNGSMHKLVIRNLDARPTSPQKL